MKLFIPHLYKIVLRWCAHLFALHIKLNPIVNLTHEKGSLWVSHSKDPQILVRKRRRHLIRHFQPGWYLIQIQMAHHSQTAQLAKLYVESDGEVSEKTAIHLPLRPEKNTNRFVYLSKPTPYLRLDPCESEGAFELIRFRVIPVPAFIAISKQLDRVCKLSPLVNQSRIELCRQVIQQIADQDVVSFESMLMQLYADTFPSYDMEKSYQQWIEHHESEKIRRFLVNKTVQQQPLISILLPVYNPKLSELIECIESVLNQRYVHWQLCIVDDASTKTEHLDYLHGLSRVHSNINLSYRKTNGHIASASNDALAMSQGEYILLLDQDDLLRPHTLLMFVLALNKHPKGALFYADEDKLNDAGYRYDPHFKPDWNPDLLLSQNYIGHPVLLSSHLIRKVGGFRSGFDGSQDHDLLLRYTAAISAESIHHLPWILYHWRAGDGSTAKKASNKSYTETASLRALNDLLMRQGIEAKAVVGKLPNTYRVIYQLPKQPPLVSLIIPTKDKLPLLKKCVDSILNKTDYTNYEIVIVDNQSSNKDTLTYLNEVQKKHKNIRVISYERAFNYSAINNFAVTQCYGEIIGLINNDIEVITKDWLTEMVSHALRPNIGCVGAKLYYPNKTIQHAGVILGVGGVAGHSHKYFAHDAPGYFGRLQLTQNLSAVTAACLLVKKSIYLSVNGLDEVNLPVAFNDVDLCLRVKEAGYRNLFTPWAELYHHESISRGKEDTLQKQKRAQAEIDYMKKRWGTKLHHDEAYNRNLTLTYENFSLR